MCVDAANCDGSCPECMMDKYHRMKTENKRLKKQVQELSFLLNEAREEIASLCDYETYEEMIMDQPNGSERWDET